MVDLSANLTPDQLEFSLDPPPLLEEDFLLRIQHFLSQEIRYSVLRVMLSPIMATKETFEIASDSIDFGETVEPSSDFKLTLFFEPVLDRLSNCFLGIDSLLQDPRFASRRAHPSQPQEPKDFAPTFEIGDEDEDPEPKSELPAPQTQTLPSPSQEDTQIKTPPAESRVQNLNSTSSGQFQELEEPSKPEEATQKSENQEEADEHPHATSSPSAEKTTPEFVEDDEDDDAYFRNLEKKAA